MSRPLSKILLLAVMSVVIVGCKLAVIVGEGGEVQSLSGTRNCSAASYCANNITDINFSESFTAVAKPGYQFVRWQKGTDFLCGDSTNLTCTVALTGNAATDAVITSLFHTGNIMPIFKDVGIDTDGDGVSDRQDEDDDNDGILDVDDSCHLNPNANCSLAAFCGSAASFTGQSATDSMTIPSSGNLHLTNAFTIESRVFFRSWSQPGSGSGSIIVDKFSGSGNGREYRLAVFSNGMVRFWMTTDGTQSGAYTLDSTQMLPLNKWVHLTVTSDGTTLKMYIDGKSESSKVVPSGPAAYGNQDLAIGGQNCCGSTLETFDGFIDEVRISDFVRYTQNFPIPTAEFVPDANTLLLTHFSGDTNNYGLIGGEGVLAGGTTIASCQ